MRLAFALLCIGVASCRGEDEPVEWNGPFDSEIPLRAPVDRNPDPKVLEVDLEARIAEVEIVPGKKTKMWTYDGGVPGPLLRAKVGDTLVVHFKNSLPEATSIHWHGLRVPAAMDGNGMPSIPPGGTFEYRFTLPDAGTFWYHPHVNSAAQLGFGLYGALVVDEPGVPLVADESTVVLSDASIDDDGVLVDAKSGGAIADLFGREGAWILVNGKVRPTLHGHAGVPLRLRLINAARSRYFQLKLDDHVFTTIGGDGGLRETPRTGAVLLLAPGERYDVVVVPRNAPNSTAKMMWVPFERGFGTAFARDPELVMSLAIDGRKAVTAPALPARLRTIAPVDPAGAKLQRIELTQTTDAAKTTTLGINGKAFPDAMPVMAKVGETNVWEIVNTTDAHHPFHLHGFFFQVLDAAGAPLTSEWKDTLDIPKKESRKVVVRYDDRPGMWMFHCHILDHAELGMMGMLELTP